MAVNRFGFCLDQNQFFGGRKNIIIEGLQVAVACRGHIEKGSDFFSGLERVFDNSFVIAADLGVMLAVQHGFQSADTLCPVSSLSDVPQCYFLLCLYACDKDGQQQQGEKSFHGFVWFYQLYSDKDTTIK